jgi:glutathione S-transferase
MLFEARAICRILAHKYQINPAGLSLPTDTDALGAFEQAASVECAYFQPAVEHLRLMKYEKDSGNSYMQHTNHTQSREQTRRRHRRDCCPRRGRVTPCAGLL